MFKPTECPGERRKGKCENVGIIRGPFQEENNSNAHPCTSSNSIYCMCDDLLQKEQLICD